MKSIKSKVLTIVAMVMMVGFTTSVIAQEPDTRQENNMGTEQEYQTTPQEQNQQTLPEDPQEHMGTEEEGVFPQEQNQLENEAEQLGDDIEAEYNEEIEETELPATVSTSLETMYPDSEIEKVYRGTDNSYKVKVKDGDKKSVVFYDANGTFVKEKDADHKEKDENKDW